MFRCLQTFPKTTEKQIKQCMGTLQISSNDDLKCIQLVVCLIYVLTDGQINQRFNFWFILSLLFNAILDL